MQVRRWHKFLVLGVVALCLLIAGMVAKRARAGPPGLPQAKLAATLFPTPLSLPQSARRSPTHFPSPVSSFLTRMSNCMPRWPATSSKIYVDIGDRVHTGEVLAVLEIPELVAQIDEAKAGVHHAEEEIQQAKSEVSARGSRQCCPALQRGDGWSTPIKRNPD